jgi:hypothetical protein
MSDYNDYRYNLRIIPRKIIPGRNGMRKIGVVLVFLFLLYGCAEIFQFGKTDDSRPMKCIGFLDMAKKGMTQKEVEKVIGLPQKREFDMTLRGVRYDEVWVYDTDPPTVLYFKGNILQHKEYQQKGIL